MEESHDIVIVGGGICGLATALALFSFPRIDMAVFQPLYLKFPIYSSSLVLE